jgi:pantothenate kinase-related protein Tda10
MDYKKLKKEELIKIVEEQALLASAIQGKDQEITDLKEKHKTQIADLRKNHAVIVDAKDAEYQSLQQEIEIRVEARTHEIRKQYEERFKKQEETIAGLTAGRDRRISELDKILYAHGDLLKSLESVVNTHLTLNGYIIREIQEGSEIIK